MFDNPKGQPMPTSQFLGEFKERMNKLTAPAPTHHSQPASYVPKDLALAEAVYVRHDAVRGPLQRPYDGPFKVIRRELKYFVIDKNGKHDSVSIDRLKVAYPNKQNESATSTSTNLLPAAPPLPPIPTTSTRTSSYAEVAARSQMPTRSGRIPKSTSRLNL